METDFKGFHEIPQFSTHSLLSSDEVMKYQLRILESIKTEEIPWQDESITNDTAMGKEDFQQIMSEWQNHLGSLQITEPEDVDVPLDLLNSSDVLFDEKSPILSKALNCPVSKLGDITQADMLDIKQEPIFDSYSEIPSDEIYTGGIKTEPVFDNELLQSVIKSEPFECDPYQKAQSDQKYFNGTVKTEGTVVRKLTLLNGEKEILGKNIIGLHSLNEIKENPDQNCQVTSTVINGKRYKIIIKPKSQRLKKYNEEKIKKTLIKKLSRCNLIPKLEPKEDEIISEMRNGNYDVPILENDTLLDWDMNWFDNTWDNTSDNNFSDVKVEEAVETPKKVPPLKIKIPKPKKCKKKKAEAKSDEDIDVETIAEKAEDKAVAEKPSQTKKKNLENENIKNSLPKEMVDRIESLKRKKDGRIPLVQVIPVRKNVRSGTRMQDAAATINRNKLLKIVSGGDTVQLDHDYCSNTFKNFEATQCNTKSDQEVNLTEKNPKKDSGMESGDVSDASEDPQMPESINNLQSIQEINNKLLEQRRNGKTSGITKVAAAFFRAANVITSNGNVNNSDVVKTLVVSNGNKALTNDSSVSSTNTLKSDGDKSDIVPSGSSEVSNSNDVVSKTEVEDDKNVSGVEVHLTQPERPKKKLKLEEYLSRRNGKASENGKDATASSECKSSPGSAPEVVEISSEATVSEKTENKEILPEKEESKVEKNQESRGDGSKGKKSRRCRSRRSSSTSSGEREDRRKERSSRSRSTWRGSRKDSWSRHKYRNSTSNDRKRSYWSRSLSRSSSRESSSSSDRSGGRRKRRISPVWYHRRSRSRSISRERSRSRNRSSNRRRQNHYFNRNFYSRRSRSPYRGYSVREKQRQIEERRVIYIGRIEEGMTNAKLRERFGVFGPIVDISLHFREYGDNYGFVTYAYKDDAYDAVEHGNDDPTLPRYDLCFGGRRGFCKERYADLDGMPTSYSGFKDTPILRSSEESFDLLLKEAQAKLKQRISKENKA